MHLCKFLTQPENFSMEFPAHRWKVSDSIGGFDSELSSVAEAKGFGSVAQSAHVSSYPLERNDPYECSRDQAEEPEDIHADTNGVVDSRFTSTPCDPVLARRLGDNLSQEVNAFLSGIWSEGLV